MGKKRKASEAPPSSSDQPKRTKGKPDFRQKDGPLFEPRSDWHAAELPALPEGTSELQIPPKLLEELSTYAQTLLDEETARFQARNASSRDSSRRFIDTVMTTGTQEDKISALTLSVQESPLHNRKSLDSLIAMAKKRSRNHAIPALSALVDLMSQGEVLPENRRLRYFAKNSSLLSVVSGLLEEGVPLRYPYSRLPKPLEPIHLISWAFEDYLKTVYFEIIQALEVWYNDEVEYTRSRALSFIYNLLTERPEQEENLLLLLVNKLGDRSKKVASRASYLLIQLQTKHPMMKPIIIKTIESEILFKPGQHSGAKYYAVTTLNQTVLSRGESELADKLVGLYIALFLSILKEGESDDPASESQSKKSQKKGKGKKTKAGQRAKKREADDQAAQEVREKMVGQILTGINRAFPFADTDGAVFESHINTIYRIAHSSNFNTAVQALSLLYQVTTTKQYSLDRFYRVLYETLLDPRLHRSSKQVMYLNLLYRTIKGDLSVKRVKSFVKRLLQVSTIHEPAFACGVLYLVSELMKTFPDIKSMVVQPEEQEEDETEHFVDVLDEDDQPEPVSESQPKAEQQKSGYDGRKRDPLLSEAEKSCLWELVPYQAHFHPSVALFGSSILTGSKVPPKPDPTLHTLIHFLDRFVYRGARKPKANSARGGSIMQPLVGSDATDILVRNRGESRSQVPLNDPAFWRRKVEDIPVEEVFFHQYFHKAGKAAAADLNSKKSRKAGDDNDSEGEMDEDAVWKAIAQSRPEVEGDVDDDEFGSDDDVDMGGVDFDSDAASADEEAGEAEATLDDVFADDDDESDGDDDDEGDMGLDSDVGSDSDDDASVSSDVERKLTGIEAAKADSGESGDEKPKTKSQEQRARKRKLKSLPVFASADDYAALIDG